MLKGSVQVIYIGDMEPDHTVRLAFEEEDQRQLTAAIKLGSQEEVERTIRTLMDRVREAGLSLPQCTCFSWKP